MTRLLLVEDEVRLARSIMIGLKDEGYVVDHAADGEDALWQGRSGHHDAILLDLRIPKVGGLEVCRRLRSEHVRTPILMLTASDTKDDVVTGLDHGADDYLTKPFDFSELLARLRALLRRSAAGQASRMQVADLIVDVGARRVWRGDTEIGLSNLEYRLLEFLVLHAGVVQSKTRIAAAIWDDELGPESNVIEVLVSTLRKKIDRDRDVPLLRTRRGAGYVLSTEES